MARPADTTPRRPSGVYRDDRAGDLEAVGSELRRLASEVDRAAYAAAPPGPEHVERAWACSDRVTDELRRSRNAAQRLRMRLDPGRCSATRPRQDRAGEVWHSPIWAGIVSSAIWAGIVSGLEGSRPDRRLGDADRVDEPTRTTSPSPATRNCYATSMGHVG